MRRSRTRTIRLLLLGGISAGALAGCKPDARKAPITQDSFYTNNYYVPGAGYYHAPFRAWYSLPYNHFDTKQQRFFYGGQWAASPYESVINISSPTPEAASMAQAVRTDISRGGFGSTSHSYGGHGYYSHS